MDKKIPQLDPAPSPIPDDWVFAVSSPDTLSGEAMMVPFSQIKGQILPNTDDSGIKVFYVDGNNLVAGDGSILNPFQTIDLAYTKVLGSGTPLAPEYQSVNIKVAAATYTTSLNLWLNNVTYTFDDNSQVTYIGTDYLIDLSAETSVLGVFAIRGSGNFTFPNGGMLKNTGIGISQALQKNVFIEVNNVNAYTPLGVGSNPTMDKPLFWVGKTATGGGYSAPNLVLIVKGLVNSLFQTIIFQDGSVYIGVSGTNPQSALNYARRADVNEFPVNGHAAGCVWRYINLDTSSRKYMGTFNFSNINMATDKSDRVIYLEGSVGGTATIKNVNVVPDNGSAYTGRVIEFGDIELVAYPSAPLGNFIIENLKLSTELTYSNNDVVRWVGVTSGKNKLDFVRCIFPGATFVNANVNFNGNIGCAENMIKNKFHISNVPTYADNAAATTAGLTVGMVYRTSTGSLQITY